MEQATGLPAPPARHDGGQRVARLPRRPFVAMAVTGAGLLVVVLLSQLIRMPYGRFSHLPIYGIWKPVLDPLALTVVPAGLVLAAVAWAVTSSRRVPTWLALTALIGAGVVAAAAIGLVRGDRTDLVRGVSTLPTSPYYTSDLHFVHEYGIRGFVAHHAELVSRFHSPGSQTHPAGIHLLLSAVFSAFGPDHPLRVTTALAAIAMAGVVAAWMMGRELAGDDRSGRIAAALFAAAPGPLLLAYTSMDAVYATALASAMALLLVAGHRRSPLWAAAGGAVLGVATLLTYATVFVALAAVAAVAVQAPSIRAVLRLIGPAVLSGALALGLARLALGFDVLASYRAVPAVLVGTYHGYWVIGAPTSVLIFAGIPIATFAVIGLLRPGPDRRAAVLPLALIALFLIWVNLPADLTRLRQGEVERTWAFLYPMLAASAAPVVHRWTSNVGRWTGGAIVALLVVVSVVQAVVIQGLWDTLF